jgi:hypothetical protein
VYPLNQSVLIQSQIEHLVYNMLFPPSAIHLSSDPPTKSWSNGEFSIWPCLILTKMLQGRFSMATFPRVKRVRIVCRLHPWLMEVTNDNGVTVGDVCDKVRFKLYLGSRHVLTCHLFFSCTSNINGICPALNGMPQWISSVR